MNNEDSLRINAAIQLRVPNSGIEWLDKMITKAKRDEFASQAMLGILSSEYNGSMPYGAIEEANFFEIAAGVANTQAETVAWRAYATADAMIVSSEDKSLFTQPHPKGHNMSETPISYPLTDRQTILDLVWNHFVTNKNPRSFDFEKGCQYSGTGCAVGCLLPKDVCQNWDSFVGPTSIRNIAVTFTDSYRKYFGESEDTLEFLRKLQSIHDDYTEPELFETFNDYMRYQLTEVANLFGLKIPE